MNVFNKMFIDTEELQSEIIKLKNSILNSLTEKGTAIRQLLKRIYQILNLLMKIYLN